MLSRLRAAITPAAALLLAALMLIMGMRGGGQGLETRIARTLSRMEGAGRVTVTIRTAYQSSGFGAGGQYVPCGAVVVAQGAEDMAVRLRLIRAVRTLLGLPETAGPFH